MVDRVVERGLLRANPKHKTCSSCGHGADVEGVMVVDGFGAYLVKEMVPIGDNRFVVFGDRDPRCPICGTEW